MLHALLTLGKGVTKGLPGLTETDDPIAFFQRWFDDARQAGLFLPESMALVRGLNAGAHRTAPGGQAQDRGECREDDPSSPPASRAGCHQGIHQAGPRTVPSTSRSRTGWVTGTGTRTRTVQA